MAEQEKPKLALPWGTLLPLIAALAGIVAQYKPLVSSRPAAPGEKSVEPIAEQDVDARLWQDPLTAAQKQKEAHEAEEVHKAEVLTRGEKPAQPHETDVSVQAKSHSHRHDLNRLACLIERQTTELPEGHRILLLAVMLDAGPYIEQSESRLRSRRAVLEGLSESGFVPKDSEHIGFVTWPLDKSKPDEDKLLIPWEECRAMRDPQNMFPPYTDQVFVLWLPATNFNPTPLTRFAALIDQLSHPIDCDKSGDKIPAKVDIRTKIDVKLIGPTNSDGLQNMIREARSWPVGDATHNTVLSRVSIISPRASVVDAVLLLDPQSRFDIDASAFNIQRPSPEVSLTDPRASLDSLQTKTALRAFRPAPSVQEIIETAIPGLHFLRTIAKDDVVLGELIKELELRGIDVYGSSKKQEDNDKVVILTEWDSAYGRALATTFAALASSHSYQEIAEGGYWPNWVYRSQYLRGIDGRLSGEPAKSNEQEDKQKNQNVAQPKQEEATEGVDQSDFLRRLARELKKQDVIALRRHEGRIRAIGLLGSDIYDKLMILRALRPEFPEAIFFTNNFDAHFERRADWSDARNLVIVSPFGSMPPKLAPLAPFRDNTQTSVYVGTLVATGRMDSVSELTKQVSVFEIGRRGAYDLNSPERYWFRNWLRSPLIKVSLGLAVLTLLGMTVWLSLGIVDAKFPRGGTLREHFAYLFCNTPFWLVWGSSAVILLVCCLAQYGAAQEPLEFFQGISIWPTEMLRLIAILLALHFMVKGGSCLKANERDIAARFCLGDLEKAGSRWRNLWEGLKPWQKAHPDWFKPDAQFSAEAAWQAYLRRNQFWPRFFRVALLFCIYFAFTAALISLFTGRVPFVPARGLAAFFVNHVVAYCAAICTIVLSFYVVDAIQLNGNFIRVFTRGLTKWAPQVSLRCKRIPPLSEEDLSRYHDVFFVAQRTEEVARLVWYPLIVLAILIVARSSFFANWTWPPVLILTFALNAMWAIGSAIFLRHAAEQLRTTAIDNLQLLRLSNYADDSKRQAFGELITEIRSLKKGAFAPLSEQPFIRAILLPGAGLGLLAVGQRVLEGF
jgi:hypothetical protein